MEVDTDHLQLVPFGTLAIVSLNESAQWGR